MEFASDYRAAVLFALMLSLAPAGRNGVFIGQASAQALIAQDLDFDEDVDVTDFDLFRGCLTGAGQPHGGSAVCSDADVDQDGDVDQSDFGILQRCFSGPGTKASPSCGGCALPKADRPVAAAPSTIPSGTSTSITVANSQIGAVYQLRKQPGNVNVGSPVAGTGGIVSLSTGPLTSTTTFNVLAANAQWGCSVQLTATVTVTTTAYNPINKIGVHVVIGGRNGFTPFLQTCANAGKPVAVIKCVDDFGAAYEAKVLNHSPQTLTVGRVNQVGDRDMGWLGDKVAQSPASVAAWYYNLVKPKWQQNPWIEVWETLNEMSSDWAWQADFYIAMMDLAEADGYRLANWSCSVGNPPESTYPDLARTCVRAKAHGGHMMSLHEYGFWANLLQDSHAQYGDSLVLRYRRVYNYLAQQDAVVPLVLTEVGQGGGNDFVGTNLFVQDFGWYDTQMRQDYYVIGCAAWTLGNWGNANFQDALPALTQYIITH